MLIETLALIAMVGAASQGAKPEATSSVAPAANVKVRQHAVPCTPDEFGFCTDKRLTIVLNPDERELHVPANIALSNVLVIWLPKGVSVPKCHRAGKDGKDEVVYCLDAGNTTSFVADVQEVEGGGRRQGKISIKPVLSASARSALAERAKVDPNVMADDIIAGERGNFQFSVDQWTVNVDLVVGPAERAVRQIILSAPALERSFDELGAKCEEHDAEEHRKLQDAWSNLKSRVAEETSADLAFNVLKSRRCRFARWTVFRDQLWTEADSICEIGDYRFITFRIRNRTGGGDRFRPSEVGVAVAGGKTPKKIDSKVVFARESEPDRRLALEDVELGKDDEVVGAIQFATRDGSGGVALRIVEGGGRERVVSVEGIGF